MNSRTEIIRSNGIGSTLSSTMRGAACLMLLTLTGCAAFRPMDGVPARYLPLELKGQSRETQQMIDLSMLRRPEASEYRVDGGDVLAVYIENILGRPEAPPINQSLDRERPPTLGYPLTVREDGTLPVPRMGAIQVRGKTVTEIENMIRHAFTYKRRFMQPGQNDRVVVTLHQPRQYRILVVRQESENDQLSATNISNGVLGATKKGNGKVVSLPAYKNDVLHALVESGGLPGLDAQAVVWVIRSKKEPRRVAAVNQMPPIPNGRFPTSPNLPPGAMPQNFGSSGFGLGGMPPVIMGPTRRYPAPSSGPAPNGGTMIPNGGPVPNHGPIPNAGQRQPNVPAMTPQRSMNGTPGAMAPQGQRTMGAAFAQGTDVVRRAQSPGRIQQASYWMMMTPRQIAENLTGIPMPRKPPEERLANRVARKINGASLHAAAKLNPAAATMPGHVQQSGCSSCQAGGGFIGNGPVPSMQPIPAGSLPGPSMPVMPDQGRNWQPPSAWNQVDAIASGAFCQSGPQTIRIPLRLDCSDAITFRQEDVILEDGDIIFIQSRDDEVFYTGGLLGGGQYSLPRDRDLDILEAIAIAQSRNVGQGTDRSSLNNDVTISASQAIVIRKLPNGSQVPILVDLYRARRQSSERIAIRPGDYIILQYTKTEAVAAWIERHILEGALFGVAAASLGTR